MNVKEEREEIEAFVAQTGVTFPVGREVSGDSPRFRQAGRGGISPYPLDVIIDAEGKIAYVKNGFDAAAMRKVLRRLLP